MENNNGERGSAPDVVVVDRGSGVKYRSDDGVEEIVINDSYGKSNELDGDNNNNTDVCLRSYVSPIKTVQTTHTVVESNEITVVTVVEPPMVGMVFKTWADVEKYYKDYAEQQGFGVSRVQGVNSKFDKKKRISMTWRCECWGKPDMRAQRAAKKRAKEMDVGGTGGVVGGVVCEEELRRGKRTSKKCECQAMVYASVNNDGVWVLRKVVLEHTHKTSPSKAKLVKEYRMKHMTSNVRKRLLDFFDEGVPVSQIHGCMASERNGMENMPLTVKDLQHEVYKVRRLKMEGGDSMAMMAYFEKMQSQNQNFFHAQRLDEQGRLKDVLWVDARSRVAYEDFGDVVCFDATYLTNEYDLPFVNFVGVNHHGQSLLLGCALVSHEDSDTFAWIFRQWLVCMNNRAPQAILTDQAAAMRKPLAEVMPNTIHRWCIWHIMSKLPEKLGKCARYNDFKNPLKAVVYESFTPEEFHRRWAALLEEYKLEDNEWLESLHKESHMWVPAYMKEYFWAGMKTTQRVESINRFFDGFVNRHTKLYEFPEKYCRALSKRVRDEVSADDRCSKYLRRLVSGFKVEKFFQKIYTDTKFQEIQTECSRMMYCYVRSERFISDSVIEYMLEDRVWIVPPGTSEEKITDWRRYYSVRFFTHTREVTCDCRKFETSGILCKHCIRILDQNLVFDLPEKYIVTRWRKDVPHKHTRVKVPYYDPGESKEVQRFNKMMTKFEPLCDAAAMVNDQTTDMVIESLSKLSLEVNECKKKKEEESIAISFGGDGDIVEASHEQAWTSSSVRMPAAPHISVEAIETQCDTSLAIKDPPIKKKPRGRPKGSRHKSLAENGYKKSNAKSQGKNKVNIAATNNKASAGMNNDAATKLPVKRKQMDHYTLEMEGVEYADFGGGDELLGRHNLDWNTASETF